MTTDSKVKKHFSKNLEIVTRRTEKLFAGLFIFQWILGIAFAFLVSPKTWSGQYSQTNVHVYAAVFLGGILAAFPLYMIYFHPGRTLTRHVIAVSQMLVSALLIHLTGGRIETHFHIFGSLAFLAFFKDWRVILTGTVAVVLDHFLRGMFWPQSIFGVLNSTPWRSMEHAAWVVFEDVVLLYSIRLSLREGFKTAEKESLLDTEQIQKNILLEVTAIANESGNLEEAIRKTLYTICLHTSWPVGHAYILSEDDPNLLLPTKLWHLQDNRFDRFRDITERTPLRIGISLPGRVLEAKSAVWISDVMEDDNFPRNKAASDLGVHAGFAFPIFSNGKVFAVLEFFAENIIERSESLIKIVNQTGAQLGQVYLRERAKNEIRLLTRTLEERVASKTKELLEANKKNEATSAQFQAIFDNAAVWIIGVARGLKCQISNNAAQKMLGYTQEELKTRSIIEITHPDDREESTNRMEEKTGDGPIRFTKRYIKKDNSILWARLTGTRFYDKQYNLQAVAIIEDITAQREAEQTIKQQQLQLRESEIQNAHMAGKSEIATGVLHNIGNVLNSANVGLETILQKFDKSVLENLYKANNLLIQNRSRIAEFFTTDPKGQKLIDFYVELGEATKAEIIGQKFEAQELMKKLQLIKDIINTQQTYAKGRAEFKERTSLVEVMENALLMQANSLSGHEIKVVKKFSNVPSVLAQKSKLIHVILNLMKNAKESMGTIDSREKILTLEIGKNEKGNIFFKISDTGAGISPENITRIFSHGFTTKNTGHGFGLHFCANSATEMGAVIHAASEGIGKGASFTVEFNEATALKVAA